MKRYAVDIDWDTDGDPALAAELPEEIEIPDDVPDEEIGDYISDETGFCHFGYRVEER